MPRTMQAFADAQAAMPFVIEQGRNYETKVYEKRYPTLNYGVVVPVVTEGEPWAIGTRFQVVDVTGKAKFISGAANDMPFNQSTRDFGVHDYAMLGSGWEWNLEEVNQAALYGLNLNMYKVNGATQSIEQLLYDVCMTGTTEKNWTGFINNATVTRTDAAATGTGSSRNFADKDIDKITADINGAFSSIRENTNEIEWADSIAFPPSVFRFLATARISTNGDGFITMLEYIRKNNVYSAENNGAPVNIFTVRDLETAGSGGTKRMVVYRRDPDVVKFHLPMPRRVIGVHQKSLMAFEDGQIARTGGTEWRLPSAAIYVDQI
jgi:hypothetical protein